MRIFIGSMILMMAVFLSACTPTTEVLPTVAQLPTTAPATENVPQSQEPTPTREGDTSAPLPTTDAGTLGTGSLGNDGGSLVLEGFGFVGAVVGDATSTLNTGGRVTCTGDLLVISSEATGGNRIVINLPITASVGVFDLTTDTPIDAQTGTAEYISANNTRYAVGVDGLLVLDALNLSDSGSIAGSFEFNAVAGGQAIVATGEFNIPAVDAINCAG